MSITLNRMLSSLVTIVFALAVLGHTSNATAASIVTNCNDSGPGSLRAAIEGAPFTGDTIDLTRLGCARITLTSGVIEYGGIGVMDIVGPGKNRLTLDGAGKSGIFFEDYQTPKSTLRISDMTLTNGFSSGGACVETFGNLELSNVSMHHCNALGQGGAIYASGNTTIHASSIFANTAGWGNSGGLYSHAVKLVNSRISHNRGGGISTGELTVLRSMIDHNFGGIAVEAGGVYIWKSTISNNRGAVAVLAADEEAKNLIADSTISRNIASDYILLLSGDTTIANSTIAFNGIDSACLATVAFNRPLHLESTILASNDCRWDLNGGDPPDGADVIGSHNLVEGASYRPLPADTLRVSPQLRPLANNGGATPTHSLPGDSPAIDRGNNILNLVYDQRGRGFPRVKGAHADIGAFER